MTQNPYSQQDQQPPSPQQAQPQPPRGFPDQPMNIYPAPGAYGAAYAGQQERPPSWPTVVGIISLCLVGFAFLMTIVGLVFSAAGLDNPQQREMMENVPGWHGTYKSVADVLWVLTYAVLAIGGILLLKRRRAARTLHLAYALTDIILGLTGLVLFFIIVDYITPPANMPPQAEGIFKMSMVASAIGGVALALAYPIFLLIWFSRAKVKQHIKTWRG